MSRNKSLGFTLLEILIAMFIFTIVSLVVVTALHSALGSQAETEKKAMRMAKLQMALLILSRDVSQPIDRPIYNAKNILEAGFVGDHNTLSFTRGGFANPMGNATRSTLVRTRYSLNSKNELTRETWDVLDQSSDSQPSKRVLLKNVTQFSLLYLDAKHQFQNTWPPADNSKNPVGPPRAVRVSITLKNWGTITQLYLTPGQALAKS